MLSIVKKTLVAAKETGNDVIVQVKGNQKILLQDCQRIAASTVPHDVYQEPLIKHRNRVESRTARVFFYPIFTHPTEWGLVIAVIQIERFRKQFNTRRKRWRTSHETAYYIATIALDAETYCRAIRDHWGIENRNHHVRDVTLMEDQSRIRINPHIFAKLRSFALNILRKNGVENVSVAIFDNCINLQNVLDYVGVAEN
jgi:predicted transposase YbfD/YdcC